MPINVMQPQMGLPLLAHITGSMRGLYDQRRRAEEQANADRTYGLQSRELNANIRNSRDQLRLQAYQNQMQNALRAAEIENSRRGQDLSTMRSLGGGGRTRAYGHVPPTGGPRRGWGGGGGGGAPDEKELRRRKEWEAEFEADRQRTNAMYDTNILPYGSSLNVPAPSPVFGSETVSREDQRAQLMAEREQMIREQRIQELQMMGQTMWALPGAIVPMF